MTPLTRKAISELRYHSRLDFSLTSGGMFMLHRKDYKWIRKWIALSLCMGFSLSGCGKQAETITDYGTTTNNEESPSGSSAKTK